MLQWIHGAHVHPRRVRVLCRHLAPLFPRSASVLDVGCGDGLLAKTLSDARPDLSVAGLDVLVRPSPRVPVDKFDGRVIPRGDRSVDAVLLVDVLHHAEDPFGLLREAARVAAQVIVIKDHTCQGALAGPTLRLMDWVGNRRHRVTLRYEYRSKSQWKDAFDRLGLTVHHQATRLRLYPAPADWVFGRALHFIVQLSREDTCGAAP